MKKRLLGHITESGCLPRPCCPAVVPQTIQASTGADNSAAQLASTEGGENMAAADNDAAAQAIADRKAEAAEESGQIREGGLCFLQLDRKAGRHRSNPGKDK